MTPTEVTEILRHLDGWPVQSHSGKKVQEAIDAAIAMIERLEAAEKGRDAESIAMYRKARDERDALRARIETMEKQEPVAWCATDETGTVIEALGMNQSRRFDTALYLASGAQPAPSVPEDVMCDARRYLWLRNAALDWYVGPEYATYNDVVCSGEYCNYAGGGVALDSAIDALLEAAPEAKP